ncbi:MAG: AAA family ATPase [Nanoarchaeota archaeon]|nr:AAA family ATPase [Nanoarchaeota archaeon]MBU1135082.1 AAA family ATPase [Nanoarchaeota archaeon]
MKHGVPKLSDKLKPNLSFSRIETGIPGLDSLMQGGLVKNSVNLVTGETGTGKTIFCSQFLWHGLQKGETGIYVTLEEEPDDIKEDVRVFGWDFQKYIDKGMFNIFYHDPAQAGNISSEIINEIGSLNAKRVVIDSTATMGLAIDNLAQTRKRILSIVNTLKKVGCTSLITSEIPEGAKKLSRFGVEEFVVDGILVMNYFGMGEEYNRSLIIRKMRRTNHGKDVYSMEIGKNGIVVKNL